MRRLLYALIPLALLFGGAELAALGMRVTEQELRRPPPIDEPHIATVGDSWTFGFGVEPVESYPSQLAKLVEMPVANLGEPGANPRVALKLLRGWPHRPEVLVALIGANPPNEGAHSKRPPASRVALFRFAEQVVVRAAEMEPPSAAKMGLSKQPIEHSLLEMRDQARRQEFDFLVLTYPLPTEPVTELHDVNGWIREVATEHDMWLLDLQDVYVDLGRDALLYDSGRDLHPNEVGYGRMAEAVAEELSRARTD